MDGQRRPFFIIALVLMAVVVILELGSGHLLHGTHRTGSGSPIHDALGSDDEYDVDFAEPGEVDEPPGRGVWSLVFIDGWILYTLVVVDGATLLLPDRLVGTLQGVLAVILSILMLIGTIIVLILSIVQLVVMVSLFMAPPFGTLAYLVVWGFFPRGDAAALLGLLLFLKLCFLASMVLAHQGNLKRKSLLVLLGVSMLLNLLVAFLHGLVPIILVSITDGIASIIVLIVALIWGIGILIGGIASVVKSIQSAASAAA
jgi:hypothetical protein